MRGVEADKIAVRPHRQAVCSVSVFDHSEFSINLYLVKTEEENTYIDDNNERGRCELNIRY